MFREYKVKDIMDTQFVKVLSNDKIVDVARKMKKSNASEVLVVEGEDVVGIITLRDVVYGIASGKKLEDKATEIMSSELITVCEDENVLDALKKMRKYNIGRLPVVDKNNKIVGMVSERIIINTFPSILEVLEEELKVMEGKDVVIGEAHEEEITEGVCEICGNYSEMLRYKDGKWVCDVCYDQEE